MGECIFMDYTIGIDIGTTSTKAVLYDRDMKVAAYANKGYSMYQDTTGMVEEDQEEILDAVISVFKQLMENVDLKYNDVKVVSFSSANQSLIALDKDFHSLTRTQTWGDTRSNKYAQKLKGTKLGHKIYENTGTPIHPMNLLCKILWLKNERPNIYNKAAYFCGIKEYVLYRLFGIWQMDVSIASGTGLYNIFKLQWDPDALNIVGITEKQLPPVVDAYEQFRGMKTEYAQMINCPAGVVFVQGAFDGALSNLGVGAVDEGIVAVTIGTSGAVRVVTNHPIIDTKERTFCYAIDKQHFVIGGSVNNGGVVFRWARDNLFDSEKHTAKFLKVNSYELLTSIASKIPAGSAGLLFHPFLGGERAPLWDANARGSFFGLNQMHTRAHMLRAVLEGIVYNLYTVLLTLEEIIGKSKEIRVTGGFAQSEFCCQMIADIFGKTIKVPKDFESSCLGASIIGMRSVRKTDSLKDISDLGDNPKKYVPNSRNSKVYHELLLIYMRLTEELETEYQDIADFQRKNNSIND